jgi:hypothetical protein
MAGRKEETAVMATASERGRLSLGRRVILSIRTVNYRQNEKRTIIMPHAVFALQTTALDRQDRTKETDWYLGLEIAKKEYVFLVANHFYSRKSSGMAFGQETLIV